METRQIDMTEAKVGSNVVIDGEPCRVVDVQISKPGKHGHAKVRLAAIGLLDEKKRIIVKPGHDKIDVPIIEKKTAQILSINGDQANVMDIETYESFDMEIPPELKGSVTEGGNVLYWEIGGKRVMKQVK